MHLLYEVTVVYSLLLFQSHTGSIVQVGLAALMKSNQLVSIMLQK